MKQKKFKILIIGPQGSGKGTQGKLLSDKLNIPYFAMGNLLRRRAEIKDKLGAKISHLIDQGILVSDILTQQIVKEKFGQPEIQNGYIIDGYPRNKKQLQTFNKNHEITHVFLIKISDQEAIRRIQGRRTCTSCQAVYHLEYNPPKQAGVCDKCGGQLGVRDDEQAATLKKRLTTYHQTTEPMLNHYRARGILIEIDGEQSIKKVHQDILHQLLPELTRYSSELRPN